MPNAQGAMTTIVTLFSTTTTSTNPKSIPLEAPHAPPQHLILHALPYNCIHICRTTGKLFHVLRRGSRRDVLERGMERGKISNL